MPLCKWCAHWEAILASGEIGMLDPNNPDNILITDCNHPPDHWPLPAKKEETS